MGEKEKRCLQLDPYIIENLKTIRFPFNSMGDFLQLRNGNGQHSIIVLSDYAGEKSNYEVFAFYITHWNSTGILVRTLRRIKKKYGIAERTIGYKRRKDKLRVKAFREWMRVVKSFPGICYVIVFDRRMESETRYLDDRRSLKEQILRFGVHDNVDIALKTIKAISWIVIVAPLLKEEYGLIWVSDADPIFDTPERHQAVADAVQHLLNSEFGKPLRAFGYATPFKDKAEFAQFEEMLSIPDMAAGAVSSSLNYGDPPIACPDEETVDIIEEFACIPHISQYKKKDILYPVFGCSIFELDYSSDFGPYYRHRQLSLERVLRNISPDEWVVWLKTHNLITEDVWIEFGTSGVNSDELGFDRALEIAIAFGWVNENKKEVDSDIFAWKFVPRGSAHTWTEAEIEIALKLLDTGRLTKTGYDHLPADVRKKTPAKVSKKVT